jgi:predicted cobalt transporter CbtA
MQKNLLLTILIATITIPLVAASDRSPTRGFRRMIFWMVGFNVFYLFAILYIWPRLPA